MIGLGPKGYFKVGWNKFDFFLVITAVIDLISTAFARQLQQVTWLHSHSQACMLCLQPVRDWPAQHQYRAQALCDRVSVLADAKHICAGAASPACPEAAASAAGYTHVQAHAPVQGQSSVTPLLAGEYSGQFACPGAAEPKCLALLDTTDGCLSLSMPTVQRLCICPHAAAALIICRGCAL